MGGIPEVENPFLRRLMGVFAEITDQPTSGPDASSMRSSPREGALGDAH